MLEGDTDVVARALAGVQTTPSPGQGMYHGRNGDDGNE
jgi:hypothetical protein